MVSDKGGMHGVWASRWTFILAATGSAVGLGNIWKFPYITGENGGGAFVLVYLFCILVAGIPVMMAEVLMGRKGRMSPINSLAQLSQQENAPAFFKSIGWMGVISGFFILSFYTVIAGWTLAYVVKMATGTFSAHHGLTADQVGAEFGALLADPWLLLGLHSLFTLMTAFIIARGVKKGLEDGVRLMMPLLFMMLLLLLGYSLTTDGFEQAVHFLFDADFSRLTTESIVTALGHAFFTLSLGMGAIMAYGSYMPKQASIGKTVLAVGFLDTLIAIVAGLIIFSIVFTNGLEPGAGPGLMFVTLPLAFSGLPGGDWIGTAFFLLVVIAAWSSAISIAEPAVAWAVERGFSRTSAAMLICGLSWVLGIGTVLSFNLWENLTIMGRTLFDTLDFLTTNILLPLGGILIALFVGWFMSTESVQSEARIQPAWLFGVWRFVLRFVSPLAVAAIFVNGLL
jgi:NSS family neurotransmitter:Na+ symporter